MENEIDASQNTTNKGEYTCTDITPPSMMEECGNKKYNKKTRRKKTQIKISRIRKNKHDPISHPQV